MLKLGSTSNSSAAAAVKELVRRCSSCCSDELGNESPDLVVNGEGKGNVEDHTGKARGHTLVEAWDTFILIDVLEGTCDTALVGVEALQVCLNHINRVVEHNRAETCETARQKVNENLPAEVLLQELRSIFEHDETDALVGRLSQEGGKQPFIDTRETLLSNNSLDTVENISVLRVIRELIVDQLSLDSLLWGHNEDGFR